MLATLLLVIHILVGVLICIVILMQSSKGEGLSGAFGLGQGTTAFFGADTANVLVKITTVLAVLFMLTSLSLAYVHARRAQSVTRRPAPPTESSMTAPPSEEGERPEAEQPAGERPEDEQPETERPEDGRPATDVGPEEKPTEPEAGETPDEVTPAADDAGSGEPVEPGPDEPADPPSTES
jgi:preprotein translocase subunit SecG